MADWTRIVSVVALTILVVLDARGQLEQPNTTIDLVGFWSGAYVRMDSAMPVNVRIERAEDGSLTFREEIPDWVYYGWLDAKPIDKLDDQRISLDTVYGNATMMIDGDYREMIGTCGDKQPPLTLHLKRRVPPVERSSWTEVPFDFQSDIRLSGTLVLPEGEGPHSCILMLQGRGCGGSGLLRRQGRFLAQYGIASLSYDKRGTGNSEGSCDTTTLEQTIADAEAALRALATHNSIDSSRIGFKGGSAGAWTSQALAGRALDDPTLPMPAFIVTWIGPGTSIERQQRESGDAIALRLGLSDEQRDAIQEHIDLQLNNDLAKEDTFRKLKIIEKMADSEGWLDDLFAPTDFPQTVADVGSLWLQRHRFDPEPILRRLSETPYLAVFGEQDDVVPLESNAAALRAGLGAAGNDHLEIMTIPGVGHALEHGDVVRVLRSSLGPFSYLSFDRVEPRFMECTIDFLREHGFVHR